MPSAFDEFSQRAFSKYQCSKDEAQKCANRERLKGIMTEAGFRGIESEWWHYEADFSHDLAPHLRSNSRHNFSNSHPNPHPLSKSQIRKKYPLRDLD